MRLDVQIVVSGREKTVDCPKCDAIDYGFELPDVRAKYHLENCLCERDCKCSKAILEEHEGCACDEYCSCDPIVLTVQISRVWDQQCGYCGGTDWRPEWLGKKDGKTIVYAESEGQAGDALLAMFPKAVYDEPHFNEDTRSYAYY